MRSSNFIYHASSLLLNAIFGRVILPHFSWRREENRLGAQPLWPIESEQEGEPGVKVGQ